MVGARRLVATLVVACLFAVLPGCTPDGPAGPSPSLTPVVQTPTETAQERQQRLDYAAAEKAYRTFRAEFNRVLQAGGATHATNVMKRTAGGPYLQELSEVVQAYKGLGSRTKGREKIIFVHTDGYSPKELRLKVCEDSRGVTDLDIDGKREGKGN